MKAKPEVWVNINALRRCFQDPEFRVLREETGGQLKEDPVFLAWYHLCIVYIGAGSDISRYKSLKDAFLCVAQRGSNPDKMGSEPIQAPPNWRLRDKTLFTEPPPHEFWRGNCVVVAEHNADGMVLARYDIDCDPDQDGNSTRGLDSGVPGDSDMAGRDSVPDSESKESVSPARRDAKGQQRLF